MFCLEKIKSDYWEKKTMNLKTTIIWRNNWRFIIWRSRRTPLVSQKYWICLLTSTANPAQFGWKWAFALQCVFFISDSNRCFGNVRLLKNSLVPSASLWSILSIHFKAWPLRQLIAILATLVSSHTSVPSWFFPG